MFLQVINNVIKFCVVKEHLKVVKFYYVSGRSTVKKKYRQHFNTATAPSVNMIISLITRYENLGSFGNTPRRTFGRPVSTREAEDAVQERRATQ